ncbi:MAG: YggS family pyridoxal phosphate-dependent enzyme [Clostridiales bacterium]|nr:YggS family pyridoxal phosphate-dependent enzyme [Clostridiales bacterium]MDY4060780.1 YggS family pyridoxal phosphate-dependent enzyme [Anaerovoracaceae bacterium]
MSIKNNLNLVRNDISKFAEEFGRNPEDVKLIAVTKLHSPEEINEAIENGVTDIGENKVQEIQEKYDKVKGVNWHLIGHLQRNKVKYIIDKVYMIHSVDSLKLAEEIDKRASQHNLTMKILIQVNAEGEESKFGIPPEDLDQMITDIYENCPNIEICGLMGISPFYDDPEDASGFFAKIKALFDRYVDDVRDRVNFKELSMGMSGDFKVAIREGSTYVRIGTAIFGARDYR